jgi:myo-inositol-1(or 4)-monophosphatase
MNDAGNVPLAKNTSGDPAAAEIARALASAVADAGELARSMLGKGVKHWKKEFDSPVTDADIAVDELLRRRLGAIAPGYGWQSEESGGVPSEHPRSRRWVLDPIDGTRSFIKKLPDWSIAAALVEGGRPIVGVVHAPATDEMFVAVAGGGATRNGARIRTAEKSSLSDARITGPRSTLEVLAKVAPRFEAVPRIHSLALRFARVASGEIDAALASAQSRVWDLAAADLIVQEAGGLLTTDTGAMIVYDRLDTEHPPLVAAGSSIHPMLIAALTRASRRENV